MSLLLALAPYLSLAHADEIVVEAPSVSIVVIDHDDDVEMDDDDDDRGSPGGDTLRLQYGLQFLPDRPGHQLSARLIGDRDAWIGGELRYTPGSDLAGTGRLSAGLDVLGRSSWDLDVGLFLGAAGEWDRDRERAVLYAAPIAGTEIAFGIHGERLFAKYRWLGGWGGGPIDELLTENELTVGFAVTRELELFGQYLVLSPGELDNQAGVGLGLRLAL